VGTILLCSGKEIHGIGECSRRLSQNFNIVRLRIAPRLLPDPSRRGLGMPAARRMGQGPTDVMQDCRAFHQVSIAIGQGVPVPELII